MNISTPCGLSPRFFTIVLCLTGFGIAHAQLSLPKTLDDPGHFPVAEKTFDSDDFVISFQESPSEILVLQYSYEDGNVSVSFSEDDYEDYHYIEYQEDEQTPIRITPENLSSLSFENTPTATMASFRVWFDPFVSSDIDAVLTDTALENFFLRGNADLPILERAYVSANTISRNASKTGTEAFFGLRGTPISFSSDELLALGDEDGHSLRLASGDDPELSVDFSIPANAGAQAIKTAIREAAANFAIYVAGEVADDGSLSIYADEAIEIQDGSTPTASKTLDDPGVNPSLTVSWPENESALYVTNTSIRPTHRIYNLELSDDDNWVIVSERSDYTAAHPVTYVSDTQLTPVRLYDNDSVLVADNPSFTVSLDPFVMAQHDSPIVPYFGSVIRDGEEEVPRLELRGLDTPVAVDPQGVIGTAVSFTAEEITAITAADSTSLAVVQIATGLRSTLTVPTDTDAQGLADHIQEAANPLTVYIHEVVNDDGTLDIYADEAIEIHYTTANTASIAPLRKQGVLVYPNPVHAQLHLVYPSATPATYTVYDLTGKAHSTHHASGQTHRIDVSGLSKGMYLLKAEHGSQQGVFRFVKE